MSTLEGQTVANTYKDLLQIPNSNQGAPLGDVNPVPLQDGAGTMIPISITSDDTGAAGPGKVVIGRNELLAGSGTDTLTSGISAVAGIITLNADTDINIMTPSGTILQEADAVDIAGATDLNLIGGVKILGGFGNGQLTGSELIESAGAPGAGEQESSRSIIFAGGLIPNSDATYDIGSADHKVRHMFLSDSSLYISNPDTANNVDLYKLSIDANGDSRTLTMSTSSSTTTDSVSSVIQPQSYEIVEQLATGTMQLSDTRCSQLQSSITTGTETYLINTPEYVGQEKKLILKGIDSDGNAANKIGEPALTGGVAPGTTEIFVGVDGVVGHTLKIGKGTGEPHEYEQANLLCVEHSSTLKWLVLEDAANILDSNGTNRITNTITGA